MNIRVQLAVSAVLYILLPFLEQWTGLFIYLTGQKLNLESWSVLLFVLLSHPVEHFGGYTTWLTCEGLYIPCTTKVQGIFLAISSTD